MRDFVSVAKSVVRPNVQGEPWVEERLVMAYSPSKAPAMSTSPWEAIVVIDASGAKCLLRSTTASSDVPSASVWSTW